MKYDELLKILRECNDCICEKHCPYHEERNNPLKCMTKIVGDAADAIEELQKPKWIPVSKRLPEKENEAVIVWEKQGFALIDWRHGNKWAILDNNYGIATHWMPLPEPPKEETDVLL